MHCYHAEIINLSLKDSRMLKSFQILDIKKRFLRCVKKYTIVVPQDSIEETIELFQKNLSTKLKKEWYITFHNEEKIIVVFRNKIFKLSGKGIKPTYQKILDTSQAEEKEQWDEMIVYAKSLGIPDEQCDFLPEDFAEQIYYS